jgi:transcriptional regulator with XRE-family HTH domain
MKPEDFFDELEGSSPAFRSVWALEEPRMRVAQNVYRLRGERGLTQEELAQRAGMRQPRIVELERGDTGSTQDTLVRIATALDVDIADLYQRGDRPAPRRSVANHDAASTDSADRHTLADAERRDEPDWVKRLRADGFDVRGGEGNLPFEPEASFPLMPRRPFARAVYAILNWLRPHVEIFSVRESQARRRLRR